MGSAEPPLRIALTPMHGVGGDTAIDVLRRAGFPDVHVVDEQFAPDPDFPTAERPNPEEPGAADRVLALAERIGADIALALDPDADRCALGVPDPRTGWRMLRGDETGPLLADRVLSGRRRPGDDTPLIATTIVSSMLSAKIADARGALSRTTLTGFKWLVRAADDVPGARLVYAYEEAIGMCVDPDAVRDKDGISAAVALCRTAADLGARGRTVADELDRIAREFGVHAGTQVSVRIDSGDLAGGRDDPGGPDGASGPGTRIGMLMRTLRSAPPRTLAGIPVAAEDYAERADALRTEALAFRGRRAGASIRLIVRPSGTEPKVKAYLEVALAPGGTDTLRAARDRASSLLADAAEETRRLLAG